MKVRWRFHFLLSLAVGLSPLASSAVTPAEVKVFDNASGNCQVSVGYTQGAVKSRQMNINDVKWLMTQPGGIAMFADLHPNMNKDWLDKLVAQNKPFNQAQIVAPSGSKACRALAEMAKRLNERAKSKQWPDEDTQELIIGSLSEAKYPPLNGAVNSSGGQAPAQSSGARQ
ncbi:MAG: hypothetical protein KF767_05555 [Bdellovibrionaceae bacterium]|nr:hypothetical protein [Pseudobdellovibrionaceae bacterium]